MENRQSRKPFKKDLSEIPIEEAHGGGGKRQLILSKKDPISDNLHAMTKGFLAANGLFDWHSHENIDEFFFVIKGSGVIEFENGTKIEYGNENLIYIPSNLNHRITASKESEFFFIRLNN